MKAFLDHYGWRWMVLRPEPKMFQKQAVVISTAAGRGMKPTNEDMADSLFFWGVPRIYKFGLAVRAVRWEDVSAGNRAKAELWAKRTAGRIRRRDGKVSPGIRTRAFFMFMRSLEKRDWNPADQAYWAAHGWSGRARPWKNG